MTEQAMIDVAEAERKAREYLTNLLKRVGFPIDPGEITLEEFGLSKDEKSWFVTLGYPDLEASAAPAEAGEKAAFNRFVGRLPLRRYKMFKVDARDGRLLAMKTR